MAEKIYLITGKELAKHSTEKRVELLSVLQEAHTAYPDADLPSLLQYAQQWVESQNHVEENWDYNGSTSTVEVVNEPAVELIEEPVVNDYTYEEFNIEPDVEPAIELEVEPIVEEEPVYEIPAYEEPAYEEVAVEETTEVFEPQPLPPVPSSSEKTDETPVEESEETDEDEDYFANQTVVSRQRKWRNLLSEAGKLDR
jgi:hypothetical protein